MPRECIITREELRSLHSGDCSKIVDKLKAANFVLLSDHNVVAIAHPWHAEGLEDGTLKYIQFDNAGEGDPQ